MAAESSSAPRAAFVTSRLLTAPRELVWKAWTERERLAHWWGPRGFPMVFCTLDLRPGGVFHYQLRASNGSEMWGKWVFREVSAPERLVYVSSFSDPEGNVTRASFLPDFPLEILSTVTFAEEGSGTRLTIEGVPLSATEAELRTFEGMDGSMQQGWKGTFDQLAGHLADANDGGTR